MGTNNGPGCDCADPLCAAGHGTAPCDGVWAEDLVRIDMGDDERIAFCGECADNAYSSGVFRSADDDGYVPGGESRDPLVGRPD